MLSPMGLTPARAKLMSALVYVVKHSGYLFLICRAIPEPITPWALHPCIMIPSVTSRIFPKRTNFVFLIMIELLALSIVPETCLVAIQPANAPVNHKADNTEHPNREP